jgi:hypothetical protein
MEMEHKYTPKLHDEAWMCYVNWAGSRKQNSRRSWREVDVCEIGKTRTPLCLLQSRVSICCTISETKRKKICLTILFNISVLGDRGQEDRNSRRGRESELHRQTRKLETKSQEEPERHKKIQRDSPKKKKKKNDSKIEAEWLWNCRSDDHQNPILHLWFKTSTYFNILITIKYKILQTHAYINMFWFW